MRIRMQATDSRKNQNILIALILLATCAVYYRVLNFDFVWDDLILISQNSYLRNPLDLKKIFFTHLWEFTTVPTKPDFYFYRPMVSLLNVLEFKVFGNSAHAFHGISLLLHLSNILLLWVIGHKFGFSNISRAFACLVFALHPAQTHTVCYVSCQGDLLAAFFSLLSILFWMRKDRLKWCSMAFMLLAMLSKEAAVFLPLVICGLDALICKIPIRDFKKWIVFVSWLPYFALRFYALKNTGSLSEHSIDILHTQGSFRTFLFLGRALFPLNNPVEIPVPTIGELANLAYHILFTMMIAVVTIKTRKHFLLKFLFMFLFLSLLPVADWLHLQLRFSDQLLYYPMVPLSFIAGYAISKIPRYNHAVFLIVTGIFIFLSSPQVQSWENGITLWSHALKFNPLNPSYNLRYGNSLYEIGQRKEACQWMERAASLANPSGSEETTWKQSMFNSGVCNLEFDSAKSEVYFKKILQKYPGDLAVLDDLVVALANQGKIKEAIAQNRLLIDGLPERSKSWVMLSQLLKKDGQLEESKKAWRKSQELKRIHIHPGQVK